jgi:hypothetical protein
MSLLGSYINLDRCPERRTECEAELARLGLQDVYKRFTAADGNLLEFPVRNLNTGEMGCFTSHYQVVKQHCGQDKHLHILEDDFLLASCTYDTLQRIIVTGEIDAYDILYTDAAIPVSNDSFRLFKSLYDRIVSRDDSGRLVRASFQILDPNPHLISVNSSYLIHKNAVQKIHDLLYTALRDGTTLPVDAFFRHHIDKGTLKGGCVFPFLTSVRPEHTLTSMVRKTQDVTRRFTAANIARYSFFIDCDWQKCEAYLNDHLRLPSPQDKLAHVLTHILGFSLIDPASKPSSAGDV